MPDIRIYIKQGCPHCRAAMEYYDQKGAKYTEIDVHAVPGAETEALKFSNGRRQVPIIVRDGEVEVGFGGGS